MHRTTLAAPAAILATLALAPTATAAQSGTMTISDASLSGGRCTVDVQGWWTDVYDGVGFQVNRDGQFVVERLLRHVGQTWSGQHGETVDVGAWGSGTHVIQGTLVSANGKMRKTPQLTVDCTTPPPPEIRYIDRTVEKQVFVPVPVPTPERCVVTKTVIAYVAGRHGHHGPTFTRLTFKRTDGGGVVGRTNVAHRETKRVRVTAPCGTRLRIDASIATRRGHRLVRRTVRLADDGFSTVGVSFGRYGA